nr:hypothetical protein [uncultured Caproiciproducens sp.]
MKKPMVKIILNFLLTTLLVLVVQSINQMDLFSHKLMLAVMVGFVGFLVDFTGYLVTKKTEGRLVDEETMIKMQKRITVVQAIFGVALAAIYVCILRFMGRQTWVIAFMVMIITYNILATYKKNPAPQALKWLGFSCGIGYAGLAAILLFAQIL